MGTDETRTPQVVVIGGPNGAGKSTCAAELLPRCLRIRQFVNADTIVAGLSAFAPETAAVQAGRVMLARLTELARQREDFAFETTLASRSFAPLLRGLRAEGYRVHIVYVWLRSPELAVLRVAERVRLGGHNVPADVIRRRYWRGLANFVHNFDRLPIPGQSAIIPVLAPRPGSWRREGLASPPRCSMRGCTMKWKKRSIADSDQDWRTDPAVFADLVQKALQEGAQRAVAEHHRAGNPVAIWRDGQVVFLYPDGSIQPVDGT